MKRTKISTFTLIVSHLYSVLGIKHCESQENRIFPSVGGGGYQRKLTILLFNTRIPKRRNCMNVDGSSRVDTR